MKAVIISIIFFLGAGLYSEVFPTASSGEITRILRSNGVSGKYSILDKKYNLPSRAWVYGDMFDGYVKWVKKQAPVLKVRRKGNPNKKYAYILGSADCDNRGFWVLVYVTFWNLNHGNVEIPIFIAPVSYRRDEDDRFHVINLFIDGKHNLYFIEPANGFELFLTDGEKKSVNLLVSI